VLQSKIATVTRTQRLGDIDPFAAAKLFEGKGEEVPAARLERFALEVEPEILVPFIMLTPKEPNEPLPVVVMVAQGGKKEFFKERSEAIAELLKAGLAVCLVDVRGTGETQAGNGSPERTGVRTSISQTNLILGTPLLEAQVRDLRTVIRWLKTRKGLDPQKLAVWGDSFAKPNARDARFALPLDAPNLPSISEPLGPTLAELAAGFGEEVSVVYARGLVDYQSVFNSHYLYFPHETMFFPSGERKGREKVSIKIDGTVNARNQTIGERPMEPVDAAKWLIQQLRRK
jgi:hypothetical protein